MVAVFYALGGLALAVCVAKAVWTACRHRSLTDPGFLLVVSAALSVAVFAFITAWLLHEHDGSRGDDLRTGGLAAAAVLALYGLWLNDRRRRTEEQRGETEQQRLDQERERTAGERFARSIELLGEDNEAVQLGALIALADLTRGWPDRIQQVLDVLCTYLQMPADPGANPGGVARLLQVRRTAQRLVRDVLCTATVPTGGFRLDLTGARLHDFSLADVTVGTVVLTDAVCDGHTDLQRMVVREALVLNGTRFADTVTATSCRIATLSLTGVRFTGPVRLSDTVIDQSEARGVRCARELVADRLTCEKPLVWQQMDCTGPVDFSQARFPGGLRLTGSTFRGRINLEGAYLGATSNLDDITLAAANLRLLGQPADLDPQRLVATAHPNEVQLPQWLELVDTHQPGTRQIRNRIPHHVTLIA